MKISAFIPSRYASTRLPAKPLADICGKSMIQRVWENVSQSKLISSVLVPSDDERIFNHCKSFGAEAVMTAPEIPSGTDRIIDVLRRFDIGSEIILNVQGDEPLVSGELLDQLIAGFIDSGADAGTLIRKIESVEELKENSVVKVVLGKNRNALYFSRSPIPYCRDEVIEKWLDHTTYYKHIGIYIYKIGTLNSFGNLAQSKNEKAENLEQLRLLDNGFSIFCLETNQKLMSVDTPEDLNKVREHFKEKGLS